MSDTSQGPGWWLASDAKWYPPQSAPAPLPPPPPAGPGIGYGPPVGPPAFDREVEPLGTPKKSRKGVVVPLVILAVLVIAAVGAFASSNKTGTSAVATTAPAASQADVAGNAYVAAFNKMSDSVNAQTAAENGTDPVATSAAWNAEVAARQAFDSAVGNINFPNADEADAKQVIATDTALESAEGTLAANTDSVFNYNSIFTTVTTAENAFAAADKALSNDLGLTSTTPST